MIFDIIIRIVWCTVHYSLASITHSRRHTIKRSILGLVSIIAFGIALKEIRFLIPIVYKPIYFVADNGVFWIYIFSRPEGYTVLTKYCLRSQGDFPYCCSVLMVAWTRRQN